MTSSSIRSSQQIILFDFFGRLHNVPEENLRKRKEELFEYFEIKDFAHKQIKELSTGMKQKAAIAVSLVHDPEVVIFDEPTNGLDIINSEKCYRLFEKAERRRETGDCVDTYYVGSGKTL